jgi:hypothetical protein
MLRVYLDQMHWIALTAARLGQAKGEPYRDVLALAKAAVDAGEVSFPLSSVHYMETANRREWSSRSELALTMGQLSRFHAIAPQHVLIPPELDRGLAQVFGAETRPRALQPFGVGASHAFGRDLPGYRVPGDWGLPPEVAWQLESSITPIWDQLLLAGVPPDDERRLEGFDPQAHVRSAAVHAADQERLRALRIAEGFNAGERADRLFAADVYVENLEAYNDACVRAGVPPDAPVEAGGREAMQALLEAVPTMYATWQLRRQRHVSSQAELNSHDVYDLIALPPAMVYCDVAVTERQYAAHARALGIDERFNTVVLHRLDELPTHLL